jgi:hypothetical protein
MAKKKIKKDKPKVDKELEGFEIKINTFGEIKTTFDLDKINEFLNKNVDDKKLRDRKDSKDTADESGETREHK